jgi:hypothetical protein
LVEPTSVIIASGPTASATRGISFNAVATGTASTIRSAPSHALLRSSVASVTQPRSSAVARV